MFPDAVAQIAPESRDALREVAEAVGELAVHAALVLMRIPPVHIGERSFDAEVRFEQLGNLLHAVAEFAVGIAGAVRRLILRGIGVRGAS